MEICRLCHGRKIEGTDLESAVMPSCNHDWVTFDEWKTYINDVYINAVSGDKIKVEVRPRATLWQWMKRKLLADPDQLFGIMLFQLLIGFLTIGACWLAFGLDRC